MNMNMVLPALLLFLRSTLLELLLYPSRRTWNIASADFRRDRDFLESHKFYIFFSTLPKDKNKHLMQLEHWLEL